MAGLHDFIELKFDFHNAIRNQAAVNFNLRFLQSIKNAPLLKKSFTIWEFIGGILGLMKTILLGLVTHIN